MSSNKAPRRTNPGGAQSRTCENNSDQEESFKIRDHTILDTRSENTPAKILKRLDANAVLIPIRKGTKAAAVSWAKLKFSNTQTPSFQKKLENAPAIAVCLGKQSDGICSIDFDDDNALDEFIALNPTLKASLTTAGKRGCNIWLKLTGEFPRTKKLKMGEEPLGEWRSCGGYTIICGTHPDGLSYRFLVDAPPMSMTFGEIKWPRGWTAPGGDSLSSSLYLSEFSEDSVPSIYQSPGRPNITPTLIERDEQATKARKVLERDIPLSCFYDRWIAKTFTPKQGSRNDSLIKMTTFLFHTVGRDRLIELITAFHQINYDIFIDSLTQHMNEASSHLKTLEENYISDLSTVEQEMVVQLPRKHVEAFRICRDLAKNEREESPVGKFFISFNELGARLSTSPSQAGRIIEALISLEVLEVIEKGQRYQKGRRSSATSYRWLLR